jgi:hypothetical protein
MNILTKSPATKLADFQKQAQNAYSIFTKAMSDLATTNEKIAVEVTAAEAQIKELAAFTENLNAQKVANDKVIGKTKSIVED